MSRFKAITHCYCNECDAQLMPGEEHVCGDDIGKDAGMRQALENLLSNLGWATQPDNPDGLFIRAQLLLLRRSIKNAYKALGFTDEELKGYLFK
jgi:hypothetical protein